MREMLNMFLFIMGGTIFVLTCTGILFGLFFVVGKLLGLVGVAVGMVLLSILFIKFVMENM
jgi:hypothetical protein